jgi:pyruvate dehydrogenase E1 component alpha subunit
METVTTIQPDSLIEKENGLKLLYHLQLIRRFEEKCAELYTKEKIRGFLHLYVGEEAVAVGVMQSLTAEDNILSTYREHGHALARGIDAGSVMAEMYGKLEGCSRGRGGSMHLFDKRKTILPVAFLVRVRQRKENFMKL